MSRVQPASGRPSGVAGRPFGHPHEFHPGALLRTLHARHADELPKLHLLIYGKAPNAGMEQLWREGVKECAPALPVCWVSGRKAELAGPVRWSSDLFVSLANNQQETFRITPLEAMAAERPCLVSDWDGYRDTVTHDVGRRVPTSVIEGLGDSESKGLLAETLRYDMAVGLMAQGVVMDVRELRQVLLQLLSNKQHLEAMGAAGRQRVAHHYAWPVVIEQWRQLLQTLRQRRLQAQNEDQTCEKGLPPWLPPMAAAYAAYASTIRRCDASEAWRHDSLLKEAQRRAQGALDRWDSALQHQLRITREGGVAPNARLQGWLLKQGFLNQHRGA